MAIKIQFDPTHNPELPTFVLAVRGGEKIGAIKATNVVIKDDLNNACEMSFTVNKFIDNKQVEYWDDIVDFNLVWCAEWDKWFEIKVDKEEDVTTIKNVYCTELCYAELSQTKCFDIQINTESDISRKDYKNATVLYKPNTPSESLLHRLMEKVPHYQIMHVDSTIMNIQRTFEFNDVSLYDAFKNIEEEIGCLFVYHSDTDSYGKITRGISVYDLESNCSDCGHRGEFTTKCPKCGSTNITEGYGEDTTIFVTSDEIANSIKLTTDVDSVKNCFKLVGGDDLMTATIRACNPSGSDYMWYADQIKKQGSSTALKAKLNSYDTLYDAYQNTHIYNVNSAIVIDYNIIAAKYRKYKSSISDITTPIVGYPALTNIYYDAIDFSIYLKSELMPDVSMSDTSASEQLSLLTVNNLSPIASSDISNLSSATADNIVTQAAKSLINSSYKIDILDSSLEKVDDSYTWTGKFKLTNYSDEEDTATSKDNITLEINDDYRTFIEQKVITALHDNSKDDVSITALFNLSLNEFAEELKKYCLDSLSNFQNCCQSCIDVLVEQDISNSTTWASQEDNLYDELYTPYLNKLQMIEYEMKIREHEIAIINGITNSDGKLTKYGLKNYIDDLIAKTQDTLNFENYLGEDLWKEFLAYRREDKYKNDNYISDGLDNAELLKRAMEFIETAKKEIYKSAELQHSITTTLKNLLMVKKFEPIVNYFSVGNWFRIQIDDEVYKLRLLSYEINYDSIENITVDFSDVFKTTDGLADKESLINKTTSMTRSYTSTQRQAQKGQQSKQTLDEWNTNGLNTSNTKIIGGADNETQTWDNHGMLFRRSNPLTGGYDPTQFKIIHCTMALTTDGWKTTKTAVGYFTYTDPVTKKLKKAYGINGEVIYGKLLIGEGLGIYNSAGSLTFDESGFVVKNNVNTITINPNAESIFTISNKQGDIISMDKNGNGIFNGGLTALTGNIGGWYITRYNLYAQFSTQSVQWVERQIVDGEGNLVYRTEYVYDSNGDPVYETDEYGETVYNMEYVYDANGNIVYETDENGNVVVEVEYVYNEYEDENGELVRDIVYEAVYDENGDFVGYEPMTQETPVPKTKQVPVQKTQQIPVMESVQEVTDNYYNNYTSLSSTGNIALSIGATQTDNDGVPIAESGAIKLYNDGNIYAPIYHVNNGTAEPCVFFERKRSNGEITVSRIYSVDNDTPMFAFAFRATTSGSYVYSTLINKDGIMPYNNNSYYCGTSGNRWGNMFTKNLDVNGSAAFPNVIKMRDEKNRSWNVINIYHDGDSNGWGSNLVITGSGNTFIGSGESPINWYNLLYKNNSSENLFVSSDGYIYFATNCQTIANRKVITIDPSLNLRPHVNGVGNLGHGSYRWNNIYSAHSVSVSSDERLKTNIHEIDKAKELLMALKPIQYMFTHKTSDRIHYGFSSQQFKRAMDEVGIDNCGAWTVDITNDGLKNGHTVETATEDEKIYGLRYEELIAPIVAVLQELNQRIEKIESSIN